MLGTHDSYTYLTAKKKIFEWVSFLWRTQVKSIEEQKKAGVSYFDIRVRRDNDVWRICHGLVDFNLTYKSIEEILNKFSIYKVRIILERGDREDLFRGEVTKHVDCPTLSFACIKRNWKILLDRDASIIDYTYTPWLSDLSFWENVKRFNFFSTIKKWAKKHNPTVTTKMKTDKNIIYFMDYI